MAHYVCVTRSGLRIVCSGPGEAPQIQFGNDAPIALPDFAYYPTCAEDEQDVIVSFQGGEDNLARIVSRTRVVKAYSQAYGQNATAMQAPRMVYVTASSLGSEYTDGTITYPIPHTVSPTSQGIAWTDSSTVHFRDFNPQSPSHPDGKPTIHGVLLSRQSWSGDWMVGMGEPNTIYAYRKSTDELFSVWTGYTPVSPSITEQTDGSCVVCINLIAGSQFYPSANFLLIPKPVEPLPGPAPVTGRQAFRRPMMFAPFFSYSDRYGATDDYIGNVVMPSRSFYATAKLPLIQFLNSTDGGGGYDPSVVGNTLAYFIHGGGDIESTKAAYLDALKLPQKPVILYLDSRAWPSTPPSWINLGRTFLGVQTYRGDTESAAAFSASMTSVYDMLTHAWKCPIVQVPSFYTHGLDTGEQNVLESMTVYDGLIRDYYVVGVLPFADRRPTGMADHPALRDACRSLFTAVPGRPNRLDYWLNDVEAQWKKDSLTVMAYELLNPRLEMRDYWSKLVKADLKLP